MKPKSFEIKKKLNNSKVNESNNIFQKYIRLDKVSYKINKINSETNTKNNPLKLNKYINNSINNHRKSENLKIKLTKSYFDIPSLSNFDSRLTNYKSLNVSNNYFDNIKKDISVKNIPLINSNLFTNINKYKNNSNISLSKNYNIKPKSTIKMNNSTLNDSIRLSKQIIDKNNNNLNAISSISSNERITNYRVNSYLITSKKYNLSFKTIETEKSSFNDSKRTHSNKGYKPLNKGIEFTPKINYIKYCDSITVPGINEKGRKKINQDSYIIERNINGIHNFNIFGVLDGHGEDGHYASQFVSRYIINSIKNNSLIKKCSTPKEIYDKIKADKYKLIEKIYLDADVQIRKEKFDYYNSGTTCIIVIQLEDKLICANTGDSRAIIIYNKIKGDKNMSKRDILQNSKIFPLSYDCKPDLPKEKKRIYECGGTVEKDLDENNMEEVGPFRVYAKGEDYPGLAMSRSIGDIYAKRIGVIPNPQFIEYTIKEETKYMIICSDGIWEFISNEEAKNIANRYYIRNDPSGLCQYLYKKSVEYWNKEDIVVDDITAIVVFF